MSRKKRNKLYKEVFESVRISDFAAEGKALCRINDMVVFVRNAAPGDLADIRITKTKRKFLEAEIINIHEKSEFREDPFCPHYGVCGGCKWQHLKYKQQLFFKQHQVVDNIERIGKIPKSEFNLLPIKGSEKTKFYRNKLEFSFTDNRWLSPEEIDSKNIITDKNGLGFHVPGCYDKVLDIDKCYLQPEPSNKIRLWLKEYAIRNKLEFYDVKHQSKGWLRNVVIRNNTKGDFLVNIVVSWQDDEKLEKLFDELAKVFPEVNSMFYTINTKKNSSITDLKPILCKGRAYIEEEIGNIKYRIGANSFFQTNSYQTYTLYSSAAEFAGLSGSETVYDLYTGTGSIANFVAKNAKKVIGIEYVEEAIDNAKENSEINNIKNTEFICGDIAKTLTGVFFQNNGLPDIIITDPPRSGMHPDVVNQLCESGAKKIIYISCNPATQARDIGLLAEKYKLEKVQAVDMFPHTMHVENVALLSLKK